MTVIDSGSEASKNRRWGTIILMVIALLVGATLLPAFRQKSHRLHLQTCFQEAGGLSNGAPVRMFGVDVGTVRRVQVNPSDRSCPVSVQMLLQTEYGLDVPLDSQAYTSQFGVLGPIGVSIDSSLASGKSSADWATIPSKIVANPTFQNVLDDLKDCAARFRTAQQASSGKR